MVLFLNIKNSIKFAPLVGTLAQLVEQWTENPCVPGSIPGGTTKKKPTQMSGFSHLNIFTSFHQ